MQSTLRELADENELKGFCDFYAKSMITNELKTLAADKMGTKDANTPESQEMKSSKGYLLKDPSTHYLWIIFSTGHPFDNVTPGFEFGVNDVLAKGFENLFQHFKKTFDILDVKLLALNPGEAADYGRTKLVMNPVCKNMWDDGLRLWAMLRCLWIKIQLFPQIKQDLLEMVAIKGYHFAELQFGNNPWTIRGDKGLGLLGAIWHFLGLKLADDLNFDPCSIVPNEYKGIVNVELNFVTAEVLKNRQQVAKSLEDDEKKLLAAAKTKYKVGILTGDWKKKKITVEELKNACQEALEDYDEAWSHLAPEIQNARLAVHTAQRKAFADFTENPK